MVLRADFVDGQWRVAPTSAPPAGSPTVRALRALRCPPLPSENNAIQHQPNGGHTIVLGATRVPIESEADAEAVTRKAAAARVVEATAMNAVSSRSHSGGGGGDRAGRWGGAGAHGQWLVGRA